MFQRVFIRPKNFRIIVRGFSAKPLIEYAAATRIKSPTRRTDVWGIDSEPVPRPSHAFQRLRWLVPVLIFFVGTASGADDAVDGQDSEMASCGSLWREGQGDV